MPANIETIKEIQFSSSAVFGNDCCEWVTSSENGRFLLAGSDGTLYRFDCARPDQSWEKVLERPNIKMAVPHNDGSCMYQQGERIRFINQSTGTKEFAIEDSLVGAGEDWLAIGDYPSLTLLNKSFVPIGYLRPAGRIKHIWRMNQADFGVITVDTDHDDAIKVHRWTPRSGQCEFLGECNSDDPRITRYALSQWRLIPKSKRAAVLRMAPCTFTVEANGKITQRVDPLGFLTWPEMHNQACDKDTCNQWLLAALECLQDGFKSTHNLFADKPTFLLAVPSPGKIHLITTKGHYCCDLRTAIQFSDLEQLDLLTNFEIVTALVTNWHGPLPESNALLGGILRCLTETQERWVLNACQQSHHKIISLGQTLLPKGNQAILDHWGIGGDQGGVFESMRSLLNALTLAPEFAGMADESLQALKERDGKVIERRLALAAKNYPAIPMEKLPRPIRIRIARGARQLRGRRLYRNPKSRQECLDIIRQHPPFKDESQFLAQVLEDMRAPKFPSGPECIDDEKLEQELELISAILDRPELTGAYPGTVLETMDEPTRGKFLARLIRLLEANAEYCEKFGEYGITFSREILEELDSPVMLRFFSCDTPDETLALDIIAAAAKRDDALKNRYCHYIRFRHQQGLAGTPLLVISEMLQLKITNRMAVAAIVEKWIDKDSTEPLATFIQETLSEHELDDFIDKHQVTSWAVILWESAERGFDEFWRWCVAGAIHIVAIENRQELLMFVDRLPQRGARTMMLSPEAVVLNEGKLPSLWQRTANTFSSYRDWSAHCDATTVQTIQKYLLEALKMDLRKDISG